MIWRRYKQLLADAGLPAFRIHDLRHGWALAARTAGAALREITEQLGHSHPSITARMYEHRDDGLLREAARRVGKAIRGQ